MRKQTIIVMLAVMLMVVVGLSGCTEITNLDNAEQDDTSDVPASGVEIISYSVVTKWLTGGHWDDNWEWIPYETYFENGFYHDYSGDIQNDYNIMYLINGTVKNNAGEKLSITITPLLYDAYGNLLFEWYPPRIISGLPNSYTANFHFELKKEFVDYFDNVESVIFEITI